MPQLAGQFLGIALDISPANQITVVEEAEVEVEMRNVMREFVETISSEEHFAFITRGICRLLTNPYEQTWMPGSQKRVELTRGALGNSGQPRERTFSGHCCVLTALAQPTSTPPPPRRCFFPVRGRMQSLCRSSGKSAT